MHSIGMTGSDGGDQAAGDKWEVQLRKGCLELAILAALWSGKLYGLEILRRGWRPTPSLVISLRGGNRLSTAQPVEGAWDWCAASGSPPDAGHPRKYYALTQAGKHRALDMAGTWTRFSSSMEASCLLRSGKGK